MDFNGVWKGEYIIQKSMHGTGKEIPVPFVLRVKTTDTDGSRGPGKSLFEGICQDDPELTKILQHATVFGSIDQDALYFVKQYPKLLIRTVSGDIETHDDTHPEVYYRGGYKDGMFSGTWHMHRTFRKIKGQLSKLLPMQGMWWMKRI